MNVTEIFTKVKVHTFLHNLTSLCWLLEKKCMLVARWFRNWIYGSESHMLLYNYATSLSAHYPRHTHCKSDFWNLNLKLTMRKE